MYFCVVNIHILFHFNVSIWFPCLILALVWPSMYDLWLLRCWKISFEPRMELKSTDRTWFISNLKTLGLNAWLFVDDARGWALMSYHRFKVTRNRILSILVSWFWHEYGIEMFVNEWEWSEWNLIFTSVNTLC